MARSPLQIDNPERLAEALQHGDERMLARVLTLVENQVEGHEGVLDAVYPLVGSAWRIGLTGPPGSGKSTLAARIIRRYLGRGMRVAYLGVDPSSPFSGGALLGDRVRIGDGDEAGNFFARSLATRGAQGGLSEQTEASVDVLDAAGFDVVIVESVGVGQAEIDIARVVDTVVVVLVPESGDEIQTMKAGLLEVADVLCVNKSDRADADALVAALRASIGMRGGRSHSDETAIVSTTAVAGGDVDELLKELDAHRRRLLEAGRWNAMRRDRLRRRIETLITRRWRQSFWTPDRVRLLDEALDDAGAAMLRPHVIAEKILSTDQEK